MDKGQKLLCGNGRYALLPKKDQSGVTHHVQNECSGILKKKKKGK